MTRIFGCCKFKEQGGGSMNSLLFVFSLLLIIFCSMCFSISLLVYMKNKKKMNLYLLVLILVYLADLIFLHYNDFFEVSKAFEIPNTFISYPVLKIFIFSLMLIIYLLVILEIYKKKTKLKYFVFLILFAGLEIVFNTMQETNLTLWLFYTTRQVFVFGMIAIFYILYFKEKDEKIKNTAKKFTTLFAFFIIINISIVLEDSLVISQQLAFSSSGVIFKERNFSENLFWIIVCLGSLLLMKDSIKVMINPVKEIPTEVLKIDDIIAEFKLTKREKEILSLLLKHYDNTQIADMLSISSGTLKAHIHNIYSKLDVTHRNELIKKIDDLMKNDK